MHFDLENLKLVREKSGKKQGICVLKLSGHPVTSFWSFQYCFYYSFTLYFCAIFNSLNVFFSNTTRVSNSLDPDQARRKESKLYIDKILIEIMYLYVDFQCGPTYRYMY